MADEPWATRLPKEAARVEEDADFSAQRHFETATHWARWRDRLGLPATVLAAVSAATAFTQLFGGSMAAGFVSLALTGLTAGTTYLNPGAKAESHRAAGNAYLALRDDCRRFRDVHVRREGASEGEMILRLDDLAKRKADLNTASPQTPEWAYRKAKANIEAGQTSHRI